MKSLNYNPYIKLIRPTNWVKNVLIFMPFLLGRNYGSLINVFLGFISFSFMASVGYIINDIRDIDKDRLHTHKRNRPLANASARIDYSIFLGAILFSISIIICYFISLNSLLMLIFYFVLNYFYSLFGKNIRFIDIIFLSSFYLVRVIFGGILAEVPLTGWFVSTIIMIVLSLSISKRYMELKISNSFKLPGRDYVKDDELLLFILMINFSVAALILLNIHSYFVLQIKNYIFYCAINLIVPGIILLYFDTSKNKSDDPVHNVINNKGLITLALLLCAVYFYEMKLL